MPGAIEKRQSLGGRTVLATRRISCRSELGREARPVEEIVRSKILCTKYVLGESLSTTRTFERRLLRSSQSLVGTEVFT